MIRKAVGLVTLGFALWCPRVVRAQAHDMAGMPMDTTDRRVSAAVDGAMSGHLEADPHMRMSPGRPPSAADAARAAQLAVQLRDAIAKYRDVHVAEAEGYVIFMPGIPQPVYHFTNRRYGWEAGFRFDPAKPTSLIYKRTASGGYELLGAMYTAAALASEDELDRRVPLSVAHWHQHVNWCVPQRGADRRWAETEGGKPRFGPHS